MNGLWWILAEANKVWKFKYAFWWILVLIGAAIGTYADGYVYWCGRAFTAATYWEGVKIGLFALPFYAAGLFGLVEAWKEENENGD